MVEDNFYQFLFLFSEENPPITEQLYLYMKRFRTQPSEFYGMERRQRLEIYHRELKLVQEEYEEAKKAKQQNTT